MVGEAIAGLQVFTQLFNTARGLLDIHDATKLEGAVLSFQRQIMEAHAQQSLLVERVGDLEKELARFEEWDTEKKRYQLEEIPPGLFVYGVKPEARGTEPDHKLCANCYEKKFKSILQRSAPVRGLTIWTCHNCGFKGTSGIAGPSSRPDPRRGGPNSWMAG